ncbi:MAG: hypothetical protein KDK99_00020, partial [Verrucomicrobiales bacterium]|nr:hypothetical protein [Verrucomicrobiales bacterium]
QGFENIGGETFIYYGAWDPRARGEPRGGVGIARIPRDRFGALVVEEAGKGDGDYQLPQIASEFVTDSIEFPGGHARQIFVNADGLGEEASLRIEMLDELERPLPEYSGVKAAVVRSSGFQTPVDWIGNPPPSSLPDHVRFRVIFEGKRNTDIRFHALYLAPGS